MTLTTRQRAVLRLLSTSGTTTAKYLGVRSDVLWRLEEQGLVSSPNGIRWCITRKGIEAIEDGLP